MRSRREEQLQKRRLNSEGRLARDDGSSSSSSEAVRPEDLRAKLRKLRELPSMVQDINSDDPQRQLSAVVTFRKLLSIGELARCLCLLPARSVQRSPCDLAGVLAEINPPIQELIDAGVVPRLVQFMGFHKNPPLVFEAAWTLTNIASGSSAQTRHVCEKVCAVSNPRPNLPRADSVSVSRFPFAGRCAVVRGAAVVSERGRARASRVGPGQHRRRQPRVPRLRAQVRRHAAHCRVSPTSNSSCPPACVCPHLLSMLVACQHGHSAS